MVTVLNSFIIDSFSAGWGEHSLAAYRKALFSNPWFPATGGKRAIRSNAGNWSVAQSSATSGSIDVVEGVGAWAVSDCIHCKENRKAIFLSC